MCQYMGMEFCCTPVFEGVIEEKDAVETAKAIAALGDPVRLRIVSLLAAAPGGTACGCELESPLGLSQPTVSHHLKILREAGLVTGNREGRWVHYRVVSQRLDEIRQVLMPPVSVGV
ncbi:MAG TPA: metalloregulator ArsR/SmtB family transcription factor [Acidimicrobiia bacterium]|nr:metalloregulator ArsR/SmtB family transcription factor [Acidimicrobiia bacterium]